MIETSKLKEIIIYTQSLKLLFIEDSEEVRDQTTKFLENFFSDITTCENGKEGLELFIHGNYDLILTDINMPVMNGLDMIEKIREVDANIPILVLSAHNETSIIQNANKLNIDGYIIKPIVLENYYEMLLKIKESKN